MATLRLFALTFCSPFAVLIAAVGMGIISIAGRSKDPLVDVPRGTKVWEEATGKWITREEAIRKYRK